MGPFSVWLIDNQRPAMAAGPPGWKAARLSARPRAAGSGVPRDTRAPAAAQEAKGREESGPGRGRERQRSPSGKWRYERKWNGRPSSPSEQVWGLVRNHEKLPGRSAEPCSQQEHYLEKCNAQHFWNVTFWIKLTAVCRNSWNIFGFDMLVFYGDCERPRLEQCVGHTDTLWAFL